MDVSELMEDIETMEVLEKKSGQIVLYASNTNGVLLDIPM